MSNYVRIKNMDSNSVIFVKKEELSFYKPMLGENCVSEDVYISPKTNRVYRSRALQCQSQ